MSDREDYRASRDIWIVNHHAVLPTKDGGTARHHALAEELSRFGWRASLIVASTRHPSGTQALPWWRRRQIVFEGSILTLWVRTLSYGRSTILRMLGMLVFAGHLLSPGVTKGLPRPDLVLGSTVHPFAAWAAAVLARRHSVPFVYEVRDVWPETLIEMGQLKSRGFIAGLLRRLDRMLCERASLVVSPLPFVGLRLAEYGVPEGRFLWISNGFSTQEGPEADVKITRSATDDFTFMYLGAHGRANGLENLIQAFDKATRARPDLKLSLRLVGSGNLKSALQRQAQGLESASAIVFEDRIPKSEVLTRAREADGLVVNLLDNPVYRYGVSLNKFFMYMAAGRPILVASNAPNNPIRDCGAGISVAADDVDQMAEAMVRLAETPAAMRHAMGEAGRQEVRDNYSYRSLAQRLARRLDDLSSPREPQGRSAVSATRNQTKIVHVSSAHPWFDNRIYRRECISLARAGYDTALVAVNDPSDDMPDPLVRVVRIPRRSRTARLILSTVQAVVAALRERPDVVHLHDPELVPFIPLLKVLGKKVIYDAHEDLPAQVRSKAYIRVALRGTASVGAQLLVAMSRGAHAVVSATEGIARRYARRQQVVVHNYPPLRGQEDVGDSKPILERAPVAVYIGAIGRTRGAEVMVDAMADVQIPTGWTLRMAGSIPDALLRDLTHRAGWRKVCYEGRVPSEEARDLLLSARVGLSVLQRTPAYVESLPTKMFEYFAAGIPVVASDFPLWREIITKYECGILVDEKSPEQVAAALRRYEDDRQLLEQHSINARRAAVEVFNWEPEGRKLVAEYDRLLGLVS